MPEIDFMLDTAGRIKLFELEAMRYEKLAKQAGDDENSRRHWLDRANEWWAKARELKGA